MDRRATPPKLVTSPTWGPPPPCKQALISPCYSLRDQKHFHLRRLLVITKHKRFGSFLVRSQVTPNQPLYRLNIMAISLNI